MYDDCNDRKLKAHTRGLQVARIQDGKRIEEVVQPSTHIHLTLWKVGRHTHGAIGWRRRRFGFYSSKVAEVVVVL
jgi:hypothetical protein